MKARALLTVAVAAVLGAAVWALSPWIVGQQEPWDAGGPYYLFALVVAGFASGLLAPRPVWGHYVGAVVGQLGYEVLFLRVGPLFVLGVAFLLGFSVVFLVAAALTGFLRVRLSSRPLRG